MVRNVGYYPKTLGAVVIAAIDKGPIPGGGHQNITFDNNQIENANCVNLLITSVNKAAVTNNQFVNPQQHAIETEGAQWGAKADSLVCISETSDIVLRGNSAKHLGDANRSLLQVTPSVRGLQSDWVA